MLAGTLTAVVASWAVSGAAAQALQRTQTISLKKGWNSVYLEVDPGEQDPDQVFGGTPVDIAATYFAPKSGAQFITDPGVDLFKSLGWGVWYRGDRPDAFLTSLDAVFGRRAYLVHATSDYQWELVGTALREERRWRSDQFNFVGFPVASPGAPSFAEFFAGAKGPRTDKLYRLVDGAWKKLSDAAATPMRSGEAFWVYCEGPSRFRGPLEVETRLRSGLVLAEGASDKLILRNRSANPLDVTVEHVTASAAPVPMSILIKVVGMPSSPIATGQVTKPAGGWSESFGLAAGASIALPFQARRGEMTQAAHASLLKVTTAMGTVTWVPVFATRADLEETD